MNNLQVFRSYFSNTKVTKEFQSAVIFDSWCHLVEPPRQVYFCGIIYVIIQLYMGPMWLRCLKIGPFYNAVKPSFSHTAMITQRYEQLWYKPIPHNLEKLILNQWSLNDRKWLNLCCHVRKCIWHCFSCGMGLYQHSSPNLALA